jgi:hypothetical protein
MNYSLEYNDRAALNVPWEKYFTLVEVTQATKIDGAYPSAEFVSAAFDIPIEIVKDGWYKDLSVDMGVEPVITLSSFLSDNGYANTLNKKIYANKAINALHCEQRFAYKNRQYGFKFNYIEGRSSNFEFNGEE